MKTGHKLFTIVQQNRRNWYLHAHNNCQEKSSMAVPDRCQPRTSSWGAKWNAETHNLSRIVKRLSLRFGGPPIARALAIISSLSGKPPPAGSPIPPIAAPRWSAMICMHPDVDRSFWNNLWNRAKSTGMNAQLEVGSKSSLNSACMCMDWRGNCIPATCIPLWRTSCKLRFCWHVQLVWIGYSAYNLPREANCCSIVRIV